MGSRERGPDFDATAKSRYQDGLRSQNFILEARFQLRKQ